MQFLLEHGVGYFNTLKKHHLILVFTFFFLLRAVFVLISPLRGDEKEYAVIAKTVSFNPKTLNLPLEDPLVKHPLLAIYAIKASISTLGDNTAAYRFFALLAGCLSLIVLYRFLLKVQSENVAFVGLVLLGLNVFHIGATIANSLMMFFSICAVALFWKGIVERKIWPLIGCGIVLGFGFLNKELIAGLLVCFFIYGLVFGEHSRKLFMKEFGVILLAFFIILIPYIVYISQNGTSSRLLNKNYMLDFNPNLLGIDFYLVRLRGMLTGVDYKTFLSWEHHPMGILAGIMLWGGAIIGMVKVRNKLAKLMAIIFIFFVTLTCFMGRAEHTWAQITIFPAVFFTSILLERLYAGNRFNAYFVWGLLVALLIFSISFIHDSRFLYPPNRFDAVADYDTDLMQWYYQNGEIERAMKEAREALLICPNEVRIMNLLGILYSSRGDAGMARAYFQRALSIKSNFHPAQINLQYLDSGQGREFIAE